MYRFPWYLTPVSTNHASSNPGLASRNVGCYLRLGKLLSNKFHFNRRTLLYISLSSHRSNTFVQMSLMFLVSVINIVDFSLTALSFGLHVVFNDFVWNQKSSQCQKVNINFETCGTSCPAHTTSRYWVISSHDTSIEWNCHRRVTIFIFDETIALFYQ